MKNMCPPVNRSGEETMIVLLTLGLIGVLSARVSHPAAVECSCCVACGYDLAGLDEAPCCPECGHDGPRSHPAIDGPSLTLDGARVVRSIAVLAVWVFVLIEWRDIAAPLLSLKYQRAGLPWVTAMWCAQQNELNPCRSVDQAMGCMVGPLLIPLCLMPFTVRLPWRRWVILNVRLMLIGLLWLAATGIAACL
ncbi:MAG: hypothetical protein WC718_09055 [Phycisphaerales bacterium]